MAGAGSMRDRALFQEFASIPDGGGGHIDTWVDRFTEWARVRPERGRERLEAGRLESAVAGTITVRCSSDTAQVNAGWRLVLNGELWNVRAIIQPDRRKRYYEITAEKGVAT